MVVLWQDMALSYGINHILAKRMSKTGSSWKRFFYYANIS